MFVKIKLVLAIIVVAIIVWWLNSRIESYDLRFHFGKDGGMFVRFVSVVLLSGVFYVVMAEHNYIWNFFRGFFVGIACFFITAAIWGQFADYGLNFHLVTCATFIFINQISQSIVARKRDR